MNRWRWVLIVALVVPSGAAGFPPLPKPKENKAATKELDKAIQGNWEVTNMERGGAKGGKMPASYTMIVTIKGAELARTLKIKDREMKAVGATVKLDAGKSPAWFDVSQGPVKGATVVMKGLVKVDGDTMTWTYATLGGERPAKIDGELAVRQYRYTLKRVKP